MRSVLSLSSWLALATLTACSSAASEDAEDGNEDLVAPSTPILPAARCADCDPGGGPTTGTPPPPAPHSAYSLPDNQSINLASYASRIVAQHYIEYGRLRWQNNSCKLDALARAGQWSAGVDAIYYFHSDGIDKGRCHIWLYRRDAARYGILDSAVLASLANNTPEPLGGVVASIPQVADAQRKINGIYPYSFGFNLFESSDGCLEKMSQRRMQTGAAWGIWTQQANNCLAIFSQETFTN
jgi:hypothetical protein